jgi:hypothetical protein
MRRDGKKKKKKKKTSPQERNAPDGQPGDLVRRQTGIIL